MWKNALSAAAAAFCLANSAVAAEGSRLSAPNLQAETTAEPAPAPVTLRPARIGIVEAAAGAEGSSRLSAPHKPRSIKTSPAREVVIRKPAEKKNKPLTSSRRTLSPQAADDSDQKITFRPVEVIPVKKDSGRTARSQSAAPVGEVQYPVIPSESFGGESTAEYEEDDAALTAAEPQENLAPIISAADMPRPGRVRPTAGGDNSPPDVSLPLLSPQPVTTPAAQPEEKAAGKEPGRLSSILSRGLRLPEFRSRKSSE
jgi:hypothetical protein